MDIGRPSSLLPATSAVLVSIGAYFSRKRAVRRRGLIKHPPLNIAQFPEEIILQIFRAVHDTPIPNSQRSLEDEAWTRYNQGTRAIQSIRLTSRQFNRISSELLMKFVGVDLSSESLARFQSVMQHPAIRKGIGTVRFRLPAYDRILKSSLEAYAAETITKLGLLAPQMGPGVRLLASQYAIGLLLGNPSVRRDFSAAIKPAHQEYRRRYQAQWELWEPEFVRDVAHSLMACRKPLRIEITDQDDFKTLHRQSIMRATEDNLLDLIAAPRPSTWLEMVNRGPDLVQGFALMIPEMLAAFGDYGVRMAELHLDITKTTTYDRNAFWKADSGAIQAAMRGLRKFTYIGGSPPRGTSTSGSLPELSTVLCGCLPAARLRYLALESVEFAPQARLARLAAVSIRCVSFDARRLALMLQPLEPHRVAVSLDDCRLARGSWAPVLDLLRSRQRWTRLREPRGKEFDDFWLDTTDHAFVDPADRYRQAVWLAEEYIRGWSDINPFWEEPTE